VSSNIVIGDIHGAAEALEVLLAHIAESPARPIFLGDYINRGKESKRVLELLIKFKERRSETVFLCGNHEWALKRYIEHHEFEAFLLLGGAEMIRSYIGSIRETDLYNTFIRAFPKEHLAFIEHLAGHFEDGNMLYSHTGCSPGSPDDRSFETMVLVSHPEMFSIPTRLVKPVTCGHYVQRSFKPLISDKLVCLDTGCGSLDNGLLTALYTDSLQYIQVNCSGSISTPTAVVQR
jgi:serine/threonine protein phosphatase 1